jgi:predicted PurR-regulated permease PerM
VSFESLWRALLPPVLYFGIHLVEGETLTPMLLARRFTLNPVLIILSLVFWFWNVGRDWCNLGRSHAGYPEDHF